MEIYGLTPAKLLIAIILAFSITVAITFVTMPHPVSVPEQVITPVPTPPSVVITEQPTPAPSKPSPTLSKEWRETLKNVQENTASAFNLMTMLMTFVLAFIPIALIFRRL